MRGAASFRSGESVAGIGVNWDGCYIGASNPIPVLLPLLQDSLSFGNCRSVNRGSWNGTDVGRSRDASSRELLSPRHRPPQSAPAQARTGTPAAVGGRGDDAGQDAQPTSHRLPLLGGVGRRSPLRRRPAIGRWSPCQLVHLSAVCRDSSDCGSRKRVCTIETRNKTSQRAAPGCDPLQALLFRPLCG